mmetsp:Transcript_13425/g.56231  ORF Transcript_13425/g.56231 Transcript_13425/m.56231 type:complete len:243 (+) Transcript_13425:760-1488(+)
MFPSSTIRALRRPSASEAPSGTSQSLRLCQRTKSVSSAPGFAALKAAMSPCSCCAPAPMLPVRMSSSSVSRIMSSLSTADSCVTGTHSGASLDSSRESPRRRRTPTRVGSTALPSSGSLAARALSLTAFSVSCQRRRRARLAIQQLSSSSFWCSRQKRVSGALSSGTRASGTPCVQCHANSSQHANQKRAIAGAECCRENTIARQLRNPAGGAAPISRGTIDTCAPPDMSNAARGASTSNSV